MNKQVWHNSGQIQRALEEVFNDILHQKLSGMPIVNPNLYVQALPFHLFQHNWVGVLITPWFMNLLLLPGESNRWTVCEGDSLSIHFPYGMFKFTVTSEKRLGFYATCSLYSPMFEFKQQEVAVTVAQSAFHALFAGQTMSDVTSTGNGISRRDLLRGAFKSREKLLEH